MQKKNIALVMGGFSGEHDISIMSGCQVYENLDHEKYNVYKIVIDREGWYWLADDGSHRAVNRDNFTIEGVERLTWHLSSFMAIRVRTVCCKAI